MVIEAADHLRFSPDILRRLGEELVPNPDQGVVELVRNAYDADARTCIVEFVGGGRAGTSIRVTDDGGGMDAAQIRDGWLVLGRSSKARNRTTRGGRLAVGDKGLGRLAALRLGEIAQLTSRPTSSPGVEYSVLLDWRSFDNARVVEDVDLEVVRTVSDRSPGTEIEIGGLRQPFGRRETQRLARALLLLADPFDDDLGFHPTLIAPEFADLESRVRNSYFEEAQFHLLAELDRKGAVRARVFGRARNVLFESKPGSFNSPYRAPAATFNLWAFLLDARTFSSTSVTVGEVRNWLDVVGGVHLYHRGLRVHPYGDPGHDWLEMNLARSRSPELKPSTNTSIGRVNVLDPTEELLEKTDRSGFVENEAFSELRRFATDALAWMSRERLRERDERRRSERTDSREGVTKAEGTVKKAIQSAPPETRKELRAAFQTLERARDREARALREDVQLYRTLATVGTTSAIFAHDSAKPVTQILSMVKRLDTRGQRSLGDTYEAVFKEPVGLIAKSATALQTFSRVPLYLLQASKRRSGNVDVTSVVADMTDLFMPFLSDAAITVDSRAPDDASATVWGTVAAVESIVANLITNAIGALASPKGRARDRRLAVSVDRSDGHVSITVSDNGPGLVGIASEDVWLPGRTTTPGGTGLGLAIVRDAAMDLGGEASIESPGVLGGVDVVVVIPVVRE
jgi:signal transduction histidine kinase